MGTTARPRSAAGTRARGSARGRAETSRNREEQHDEYDLLTAMLVGLAVGVTATMLMRRGPRGIRPITPMLRAAGSGAVVAGKAGWRGAKVAGKYAARGGRWVGERGEEVWERIPRDEIADAVGGYMESAREAVSDVVRDEVRDLRRAIRRQRKRLGV